MLDKIKQDFIKKGSAVYFTVKVLPGASKTELKSVMADGAIKISIAAPPERGLANKALIKFLTKELGLPNAKLDIINGASSRTKLIRLEKI